MKFPRPSEAAKGSFKKVLPADSKIVVRPMFGNLAAFVNGHMFAGLFGDDMFVRLGGKDRDQLLNEKGSSIFEPMKGRKMNDYVVLPRSWVVEKPETAGKWIAKSLASAKKFPEKKKK